MTDSLEHGSAGGRLSISLTGGEAEFLRGYIDQYTDRGSAAKIVSNGLSLIKMIESLEPGQRLAIEDTNTGTVTPVHIPWAPESDHIELKGF